MLTIFSTPKSFRGHIAITQTNAIQSWTLLRPECEIIVLGNEEGTAEIAAKFGVRHVPDVERNEYDTPLVSSMFNIAQNIGSHELMCYVNADIILMGDFLTAIQRVQERLFLLSGQRWDIDIEDPIDFGNPGWERELCARLVKEAKLHPATGLDYFVFPRGMYGDIPPLIIGRPGWDSWMVYRARSLRIPVIDATEAITAVHQNHDFSHHPMGEAGVRKGPEARRNLELLGGYHHCFDVRDANWLLTAKGMKKAPPIRVLHQRWIRLRARLIGMLPFLKRISKSSLYPKSH